MITPEGFPAGTRVESSTAPTRVAGTVAGWVRQSIVVRWDHGGTSSAPASHGGIRPEADADLDPLDLVPTDLEDRHGPGHDAPCCQQ